MVKCQNCGTNNPRKAEFCQECGSNIKLVQCPYCNEKINPGAVKCKHCGEWLDKKAAQNNQKSKRNKTSSIRWSIILPFVFVLGITGGFFGIYNFTDIVFNSIGLLIVGILVKNPKNGARNGLITGAMTYFVSVVIIFLAFPSYMFFSIFDILVPLVIGSMLGIIFGGFGGLLNKPKT